MDKFFGAAGITASNGPARAGETAVLDEFAGMDETAVSSEPAPLVDEPPPFGGLFSFIEDPAESAGRPESSPAGAGSADVASRLATGLRDRPAASPGGRFTAVATALAVAAAATVAGWAIVIYHGRSRGTAAHPPAAAAAASPAASPAVSLSQSPAGGVAVAIAPGVTQGIEGQQVAEFLRLYFTAINSHDYQLYTALFNRETQQSAQQFNDGYSSTVDSGATLTSISGTATGLAATVTFFSRQDPAEAANQTACTDWDITLYLEQAATGYLIGQPPPGYHASAQPCS